MERTKLVVQYRIGTQEEFESFPTGKEPKPSEYDTLLDDLAKDQTVFVPYTDHKKTRGMRLAIARRAATRGFKIEVRVNEAEVAIRKSDEVYTPPPAKPRKPRKKREAAAP